MTALLRRHQGFALGALSFVVLIVAWQAAVDLGLIKAFFVSTPLKVAVAMIEEARSGSLFEDTSVSLVEFAYGLGLAIVAGGLLGVLAGWSPTIEYALEPFVWFKYSAPTIAFYPIFVAWLGLGSPTIIAIAFLFALTPIYANTLSGIKGVDPDLVRAARAFGARQHDIFLKVALPGSVPILLAGLRLAVGRALTGVIIAELFGATAGLGFSIAYHGQKLQTTPMMVSIIAVIVLGVVLTQILALIESATESWRPGTES